MPDAIFEIVKDENGLVQDQSTLIVNDVDNILSNISQNASSTEKIDYLRDILANNVEVGLAPTVNTSQGGTKLLDSMKNNSNAIARSMSDVASVMHQGNLINSRSVEAIENMGNNMTNAMNVISAVIGVGNQYKDISNKLTNYHNNIQSQKNFKQIERMNFESKPQTGLVDSRGNPITPRNARALKDAEVGQEEHRMNSLDHGTILDKVADVTDSITDENLFQKCLDFFKEVDIDKIDQLVNMNENGVTNG